MSDPDVHAALDRLDAVFTDEAITTVCEPGSELYTVMQGLVADLGTVRQALERFAPPPADPMTYLFTVPVEGLNFEVPATKISTAERLRCEGVIKDLLDALPYVPSFTVGEAYTWSSFVLAPPHEETPT